MADARISELPAATTPLDRTELIEIVQAGLNKQATIDDVVGDVQLSIGQTGGSIWEMEAATTTPPATGKVRFDSATVAAVTNVYISQTSLNGTDVVDFLQSVMVGDSVFIQDREFPDRWFRGKIMSGISDNGDWWTIPIHVVTGSGLMVVPGVETIVRFSMNTDNTPPELSWKDPVDMATTGPITLSGEQTIDGQATSTSRVLVKDQANPEFNGLYTSGAGAWTRTTDADTADELEGAIVNVLTGTVNHDKNFVMISDDVILGTTWILWEDLTDSPSIVVPATDTAAGIMKKYGTTGSNTDGTMDQNSITSAIIGVQDLFIPAAAMWPRVTNGASPLAQTEMTTSLFNIQSLDFNQTTQQYAQFQITLPRNWNNGTITFRPYWTASSGSGGVVWELNGGAYSDDDALTVAFGTAQSSTDTLITTNDLHIGPESSAITLAGSPADADFLAFQISRVTGNGSDTLSADAKLLGVSIRITTDAAKAD